MRRTREEGNKEPRIEEPDKECLRLLSTLTILIVREHEVVAAVSKDLSGANTTEVATSAHSELCDRCLPVFKPNGTYEQLLSSIWFYAAADPRELKGSSATWDSLTQQRNVIEPMSIDLEDKVPTDVREPLLSELHDTVLVGTVLSVDGIVEDMCLGARSCSMFTFGFSPSFLFRRPIEVHYRFNIMLSLCLSEGCTSEVATTCPNPSSMYWTMWPNRCLHSPTPSW